MSSETETEFKNVKSSGVLCWSCPPGTRDIYFLLGKERRNRKWRQGSNRWSDFGGGAKNNETAFDCATREFVEESLACLQVIAGQYTTMNDLASVTKNLLQARFYSAALCLFIEKKGSSVPSGVPSTPSDIKIQMTEENTNVDHDWRTVKSGGKKDKPSQSSFVLTELTQSTENKIDTCAFQKRVCFLKFIPWQPGAPRQFLKIHRYLQRLYNFIARKEPDVGEHLKATIKMYEELPYAVQNHPAVTVVKNAETGIISSIKVNSDYLEKQQIMWISLPVVEKVLENNGTYNKLLFRRGFLQILKLAVDFLKTKTIIP
jgi:hypothetical protein